MVGSRRARIDINAGIMFLENCPHTFDHRCASPLSCGFWLSEFFSFLFLHKSRDLEMEVLPLFPDCTYPSVHAPEMSAEDMQNYQFVHSISRDVRTFFRLLIQGDFEIDIEGFYKSLLLSAHSLAWKMPEWCPPIKQFFCSLKDFLIVRFLVRESDGVMQEEHTTNLAEILSSSASEHIHSLCPFHLEDNFTHCFMTMTATLFHSFESASPYSLFQKGVCALLHDIGKPNTACVSKKKNGTSIVAYPCHCLAGSIILRHIWGTHFSSWFDMNEWDLMCDAILYHMCGCNRDPDPLCAVFLAHLPTNLRDELYDLARADIRGALPLEHFITKTPCLADDLEARNDVESRASTGDYSSFESASTTFPTTTHLPQNSSQGNCLGRAIRQ
jgi:hypothetical protein